MSRFMVKMYRKNGALFLARYLKQASQLVMWYVGSKGVTPLPPIPIPMNLTRAGLPKIVPPLYRKRIRSGDALTIKMVLTILAFYRLIKVGERGWRVVKHKTIHIPGYTPDENTRTWCEEFFLQSAALLSRYVPTYQKIPLELGFNWEPMFTSGPNTYRPVSETQVDASFWSLLEQVKRTKGKAWKYALSIYHTLPLDASALLTLVKPEVFSRWVSIFAPSRDHFPVDGFEAPVTPVEEGVRTFGHLFECLLHTASRVWWNTARTRPESGRFGLKLEGAGKVRVFAISNPILQRFMKPLHDWEMRILRNIPMDGTYDQLRPLHRLKYSKELYSFDLKAATDLYPRACLGGLLAGIFGPQLSYSWCDVMRSTAFRSPERVGNSLKARVYRFTRGQPLGFYSSWPTFALAHHMTVWMSAERVYPGRRFLDYALLGDDIVIADTKVAEEYKYKRVYF